MALILAGFPGVGKSYFVNNLAVEHDLKVSDSDSSKYSWVIAEDGTKVRNENFVEDYLKHIEEAAKTHDVVCVSTHDQILDALEVENIDFKVVLPLSVCKDEYLERYRSRGSDEKFIEFMDNNFDNFIDQIYERFQSSIRDDGMFVLGKGETFATAVGELMKLE